MSAIAVAMEIGGVAAGGHFTVPVTSFAERKFSTVYRQQYDFSCGSAALASLLTFHYRDPVSEREVFVDMFDHGDQNKIRRQGFSMLDMKHYLQRRGYRSNGFKVALEQLNVPAITIVNQQGYLHFVIIKGSRPREILVGDPSVGIKAIDRQQFEAMWENRILFLIEDGSHHASSTYHDDQAWEPRVRAPLAAGVDRSSLANSNLLRRGAFDL
ncbi:C39 family peptidase [Kineobactrum salinum]|uniref:C39 family peptidase n=2 Tax=Kineobactrum salinum TaxID=2708301 RepID=A0A6C0UBV2_9GAMM|nr:C39 family peptidase [Kineobactrum salinum]